MIGIIYHARINKETKTYCDHWSGKQSPRKKLQEDDHQCMIKTRFAYAGTLKEHHTLVTVTRFNGNISS